VWCLEVPPTERALVCVVADAAAAAAATAAARVRKTRGVAEGAASEGGVVDGAAAVAVLSGGWGAAPQWGMAEMLHALMLATKLGVADTKLLEDARKSVADAAHRTAVVVAAEVARAAGGETNRGIEERTSAVAAPPELEDNEDVPLAAELAAAFRVYEAFFIRAASDAPPPMRPKKLPPPPPPPRPAAAEQTPQQQQQQQQHAHAHTQRASLPSTVGVVNVHSRSSSSSSLSSYHGGGGGGGGGGGSGGSKDGAAPATASAGEYPSAQASTNFFFYNPHKQEGSGGDRGGRGAGSGRTSSPSISTAAPTATKSEGDVGGDGGDVGDLSPSQSGEFVPPVAVVLPEKRTKVRDDEPVKERGGGQEERVGKKKKRPAKVADMIDVANAASATAGGGLPPRTSKMDKANKPTSSLRRKAPIIHDSFCDTTATGGSAGEVSLEGSARSGGSRGDHGGGDGGGRGGGVGRGSEMAAVAVAVDMGSLAARLLEDRNDASEAMEMLTMSLLSPTSSSISTAPGGRAVAPALRLRPTPFLHWSEYAEWSSPSVVGLGGGLGDGGSESEVGVGSGGSWSGVAGVGQGPMLVEGAVAGGARSVAGRRRAALRRAWRRRVAAAAVAGRALVLARRSMDAGPLVPLLRVWRHVRVELELELPKDPDASAMDSLGGGVQNRKPGGGKSSMGLGEGEDRNGLGSGDGDGDESMGGVDGGRDDGWDDGSVGEFAGPGGAGGMRELSEAATAARAELVATLRHVEADLDAAAAELHMTTPAQLPRVFGAAAAAAVRAHAQVPARVHRYTTRPQPTAASTTTTDADSDPDVGATLGKIGVNGGDDTASGRTPATVAASSAWAAAAAGNFRAGEVRIIAADLLAGMGLGVMRSEWDALEAQRRRLEALRSLPCAAARAVVVEAIRMALAAAATDAATTAARDAALAALPAITAVAAASIGPASALRCLVIAAEDAALKPWLGAEASLTVPGEALADAVTAASLDLVAAHAEALGREQAGAKTLEPLDAHLWQPPPPSLGRFPQLRGLIEAEGGLHGGGGGGGNGGGGGSGKDEAMWRLPFVRRTRGGESTHEAAAGGAVTTTDATEGGVSDAGSGSTDWELASRHDTPVEPMLEERGEWGVRVPLATSGCSRCALPLRL
jgi:uncharacterized membrane protein YgcG